MRPMKSSRSLASSDQPVPAEIAFSSESQLRVTDRVGVGAVVGGAALDDDGVAADGDGADHARRAGSAGSAGIALVALVALRALAPAGICPSA